MNHTVTHDVTSIATDWNKVMNFYLRTVPDLAGHGKTEGRAEAGTPAHWYHEYRAGRVDIARAAASCANDLAKDPSRKTAHA